MQFSTPSWPSKLVQHSQRIEQVATSNPSPFDFPKSLCCIGWIPVKAILSPQNIASPPQPNQPTQFPLLSPSSHHCLLIKSASKMPSKIGQQRQELDSIVWLAHRATALLVAVCFLGLPFFWLNLMFQFGALQFHQSALTMAESAEVCEETSLRLLELP